jgi:hypothetical protein
MLLIAGTIPAEGDSLIEGVAKLEGEYLLVDGHKIPCTQGTAAMVSAAAVATEYLGIDSPNVVLAQDIGNGQGSKKLYKYLTDRLPEIAPRTLTLHYFLPIMLLMERLVESCEKCAKKPVLIADAGAMYAAKAGGLAPKFDVFTPDIGEMAFLADPDVTHPAYIRYYLSDTNTTELIQSAHRLNNLADTLIVKGETDCIVKNGEIVDTVEKPCIPSMEAIGGTGDTITGLISAFAYAGLKPHEAALIAAKSNRMAGKLAEATPATKIWEVISQFPTVFKDNLCSWTGICIL